MVFAKVTSVELSVPEASTPNASRAALAVVAPVPPLLIPSVPVIEVAPKLTASFVDSITYPPLDFKSVENVVPVKSNPSPGV